MKEVIQSLLIQETGWTIVLLMNAKTTINSVVLTTALQLIRYGLLIINLIVDYLGNLALKIQKEKF